MIDSRYELVGDLFAQSRLSGETKRVVNRQLTAAGFYLEGELIQATPVGATGALRQGWASELDAQNQEVAVFNASEHALPTELGRRAAPVPIKPLKLWVKRKLGISDEGKALGIAIAISKTKAKRPTDGQYFVADTWDRTQPIVKKQFLDVIGADLVKALEQ